MADHHLEKHRHVGIDLLDRQLDRPKLVLVGNPNVGKSLIFNALSGMNAEVSNFPGTTVEVLKGAYGSYDVYDTPGIYSVSSFNDEEKVARDIVLAADVVFNIVDATHLERDLFLTQQLIDMGKRLVVFLNFMDEVERYRIRIDTRLLERFLGVPVFPIAAAEGRGFEQLANAARHAAEGTQRSELHGLLHAMLARVGSQAEALLVLEGDPFIAERHGVAPEPMRERIYIERRNRVNYVINQVLDDSVHEIRLADRLGRWALRPSTGLPILAAVLYLAYLFVGRFVAQDLIDFTEKQFARNTWEPWIRGLAATFVAPSTFLSNLLVGEFGIVTMTTTYLLFLLLPLVAAFYLVLAVMEDSGYLPRLATMVDRLVSHLGLNGRAVIPLILGFGCVTSATITTRLLSTEREKTITTAILQFAIPCSAQIAVIAALLVAAGPLPMLVYTVVIGAVLISIGTILNRWLPGSSAPLLLDLPPMRVPRLRNIVRKTGFRTFAFMKEATGWFFVGALAVALLQLSGTLDVLVRLLTPLTTSWLRLPAAAARAFIMGVVRRDFGAAGLYDLALSPMQITVALITITLFVPCIASLMIMLKERGMREGLVIWIGTWIAAFLIGGIVAQVLV